MDPIADSSSIWITPEARDLLEGSVMKCYVPGCESTFKNSGNLQMHLEKHHKIPPPAKKDPLCAKLYFCPQPDCVYNAKSPTKKHFKSLKYLRQHFQKVHAEKIFKCAKCPKSFGTAAMRDFHARNCGKDFTCKVCDWSYDSSEALLTHAKRKGHKQAKDASENGKKVAIPRLKNKSLVPVVSSCRGAEANGEVPNYAADAEGPVKTQQGEALKEAEDRQADVVKIGASDVAEIASHSSDGPVTAPSSHPVSLESTIYCPDLTAPLHRPEPMDFTSLETPRHCPEPDENSNYSRDLETPPCIQVEDAEQFPSSSGAARNESATHVSFTQTTQTASCAETSNCMETQTESDSICIALPPKKRLKVATTPPLNHFHDPPFCDIETQTEFDIRTGPGDPMLYTDMHTQTCHEFLTELGLSDIQTQTNWSANDMDDALPQAGTHSKRYTSGAYDELMVSTETQTSSTQCLLDSCNEEDSLSGCITQHTQTCDFLLEGLFGGGNNDLIGGFQSSLRLDCFRPENNDR